MTTPSKSLSTPSTSTTSTIHRIETSSLGTHTFLKEEQVSINSVSRRIF